MQLVWINTDQRLRRRPGSPLVNYTNKVYKCTIIDTRFSKDCLLKSIFRCDSISQHLPLSVGQSVSDSFRFGESYRISELCELVFYQNDQGEIVTTRFIPGQQEPGTGDNLLCGASTTVRTTSKKKFSSPCKVLQSLFLFWRALGAVKMTSSYEIAIFSSHFYLYLLIILKLAWGHRVSKLFIQPACFGAGCYIEMALSYHQPHQYELVGG